MTLLLPSRLLSRPIAVMRAVTVGLDSRASASTLTFRLSGCQPCRERSHTLKKPTSSPTIKYLPLFSSTTKGTFSTSAQPDSLPEMEAEHVVPDVISKAPKQKVNVNFGKNAAVQMGNELTPTQVKKKPDVSFEADSSKFYTLIMTDPDAPSRENPKFREWHHWLVVNIPGDKVSQGEVLSDFISSAPPQGTGLHRYVFLVYQQSGKLSFDEKKLTNRSGDHRGKFSARKFAAKYKLGDPIAGNFYKAEWDDYVPKVYEQLSGK